MKLPMIGLFVSWLLMHAGLSQIATPSTPGKFKPRDIGNSTSGGVQMVPKEDEASRKARYTSYITLSVSRQWTSTEGKLVEGKLIAFEDMTVEGVQGAAPPTTPEPPKYPTVTRDEKIRLLVGRKPVELPLSRLSQGDQDFVAQVKAAYAKKSP
jgi:hypothetical protein